MNPLIFFLLLLSVSASNITFYHYKNGSFSKDHGRPELVNGPLFIEKEKHYTTVVMAGLYHQESKKISFAIVGRVNNSRYTNGTYTFTGNCYEASWAHKEERLGGSFTIYRKHNTTSYYANCYGIDKNSSYVANVSAVGSRCPFYSPNESAVRAEELIGMNNETYYPVHVVNHAVMGYAYVPNLHNCTWYLLHFNTTFSLKPGLVIVGNDGVHCGIINRKAKKFIHTDPQKKRVLETSIGMAKQYFKHGYSLKHHSCY